MVCLDDEEKASSSASSSATAAAAAAARVQAVRACHKRLKGATATFLLENASAVQPFVPPALFKLLTAGASRAGASAAAATSAVAAVDGSGEENDGRSKGKGKRGPVGKAKGSVMGSNASSVVIPAIGAGGASFVQAEMRPYQIDGVNWMLSQVKKCRCVTMS